MSPGPIARPDRWQRPPQRSKILSLTRGGGIAERDGAMARLDVIETHIGTGPTLEIRTGAAPANCAAADAGTLLCTIALPSDWLQAASAGAIAKNGTWSGTGAAAGTAAHYRVKQGGTCHIQGTVGLGSGDLSLDNTSIGVGQAVAIASWSVNEPNA